MNAVAEKAKRTGSRTHFYRGVVIYKWAGVYEFKVETFYHSGAYFSFYRNKTSQLKSACHDIDSYLDDGRRTVNEHGNLVLSPDAKENSLNDELERQTQRLNNAIAMLEEAVAKRHFNAAHVALEDIIPRQELIEKLNGLLKDID